MGQADANLERQIKVSRMLAMGFVLSISWMAGVGSLAALIIGLRAKKLIRESGGELTGIKLAWWCIITGGSGVLISLPLTVWAVLSSGR